jgi:hypothetical protein
MSDSAGVEVQRAIKAVRTAHDDLKALQTSRGLMIPMSLLVAGTGLDKLACNLNLLAGSTNVLSCFCACTVVSTGTSLSSALVHDMEAVARHFRSMMSRGSAEILSVMHEQECKDIAEMVDRYDRAIFSVLIQRNVCVRPIIFVAFDCSSDAS